MVDDNFIGNKAKLKREVLPAMIQWMREHKHPFILSTETSIDLSDDDAVDDLDGASRLRGGIRGHRIAQRRKPGRMRQAAKPVTVIWWPASKKYKVSDWRLTGDS
jgi:hypothetical protein